MINKAQYLPAIGMFCVHLRVSKERPRMSFLDTCQTRIREAVGSVRAS